MLTGWTPYIKIRRGRESPKNRWILLLRPYSKEELAAVFDEREIEIKKTYSDYNGTTVAAHKPHLIVYSIRKKGQFCRFYI